MNSTTELVKDFAEYIAKNHYVLVNVVKGVCYWRNEEDEKTTDELLDSFLYED